MTDRELAVAVHRVSGLSYSACARDIVGVSPRHFRRVREGTGNFHYLRRAYLTRWLRLRTTETPQRGLPA